MNVVAVVKPLTIVGVHPTEELEHACVAHDPDILLDAMQDWIIEHNPTGHSNDCSIRAQKRLLVPMRADSQTDIRAKNVVG